MDKLFCVELAGIHRYCELELPATDYELLDALEKLQMRPGDKPEWEIIGHNGFEFLHPYLSDECDLYQLNTLSARLDQLGMRDRIAFEGLFKTAIAQRKDCISIADLFTYINSTECCHVLPDVLDDAALGRFYAENGFIPAVESVPDSIFELLDFEMLGRKARMEEGGIFTQHGYVIQHEDLRIVQDAEGEVPKVPEYIFHLEISESEMVRTDRPITLDLPAAEDTLTQVLEQSGARSWDDLTFRITDSAIPHLFDEGDCGSVEDLNQLANDLQHRQRKGELSKLKAVLRAADCRDIENIFTTIAQDLDNYEFSAEFRKAEEVAVSELRRNVREDVLPLLKKHTNLFNLGMDMLQENNAALTPYGLVWRSDGGMIMNPEQEQQNGMEVMS